MSANPREIKIVKRECNCAKIAAAQASDREQKRREEAEKIRRELLTLARRVEELTKS